MTLSPSLPTNIGIKMIEAFYPNKKTNYQSLLDFITADFDFDFYYTHDNSRIYISDIPTLKRYLKACRNIYVLQDCGDYLGLAMLWKSVGGGKQRYYIKVKAKTTNIAKNVITVLLWNTHQEVYAKVRKDNKFLQTFRNKGFRFLGGRGIQILMMYKPKKEVPHVPRDYFNDTRDAD
jgi:hypothetical protein